MALLVTVKDALWGHRARISYLFIASVLLLFTLLGARDIWTQEHRWAEIVTGMFYRQDFFHPYLGTQTYYDKPLLSYWLIALVAKITGAMSTWALRLPSACAGLLALWSIYRLGTVIKDKQLGLLSAWLLLTTFYFVFWARTSSADMLNLAGVLWATAWYMMKRDQTTFTNYAVFFGILALTSLCKGLTGAIIPCIAVFADILLQQSWRKHLRVTLLLALIPALGIYLFPFLASSYWGGEAYQQNGLYLVYRENFLRYFQPFDHRGPIYTYFIYLPIYLLPWTIFFLPALFSLPARFKAMSLNIRWIVLTLSLTFLFFTLSGSRRSYYVLPMVPFAVLLTAEWIMARAQASATYAVTILKIIVASFLILLVMVDILPAWYYTHFGVSQFATTLKQEAGRSKPWTSWQVVMLDAETKLNFYLQLPPLSPFLGIQGRREEQTAATLAARWPILQNKPANTIFITRKIYEPLLKPFFVGYHRVEMKTTFPLPFNDRQLDDRPIAFIPTE